MKLFCPSDYLALPGCLEEKEVEIGAGQKVKIDVGAIKMNEQLLKAYFSSLPKYESWSDFLPSTDGNGFLARVAVLVGHLLGIWELEGNALDFSYPTIKRVSRIPKPSRGDLERKPDPKEDEGDELSEDEED